MTGGASGEQDDGFGLDALPLGVARLPGQARPSVVTRLGGTVVDLAALAGAGVLPPADCWDTGSLNAFLARGRAFWADTRGALQEALASAPPADSAYPVADVTLLLPIEIGDYVDFYTSEQHATNLGRILRPGQEPLAPNWRHLPVGYHGRSGTVVVSGTPIRRPSGQRRGDDGPVFGPTERLDVEVEVGFVVGTPSAQGSAVPVDAFADHVFGVCLVNDWSARDIQGWESQPLGPFLGKSFATSTSPWVLPLDAFGAARLPVPAMSTPLLPYLREPEPWGLDIALELAVNGDVVSRPPFSSMHWSPAQMLAHLTVNGASLRSGDLYASGTVSGAGADEVGSLIELWGNRRFLADGDEVVISATAPALGGGRIGLGSVRGTVQPGVVP